MELGNSIWPHFAVIMELNEQYRTASANIIVLVKILSCFKIGFQLLKMYLTHYKNYVIKKGLWLSHSKPVENF